MLEPAGSGDIITMRASHGLPQMDHTPKDSYLIYDGECPFCSAYVRMSRLQETIPSFRLIDARDNGPEVQAARKAGHVIDDGMLLMFEGQAFHGADAMTRLALLSSSSGVLNRLNFYIFRNHALSSALYPILRAGRNLTVRLLGVSKLGY